MKIRKIRWDIAAREWVSNVSFDGGATWAGWRDTGSCAQWDNSWVEKWDRFIVEPPNCAMA